MIRAFRLFLLLLISTRWAGAQPLPDRVPLVGSALDGAGKPLANVLITVRRQEANGSFAFWSAVTASDARGAWRFPQAEAGRYYLSAEAPGFASLSNQSIDWKMGAAPLQLRFERLVSLRLKVVAPNGSPLVNAPLWIRLRGDGEAGQTTRRAVTDASGLASFEALLPATYSFFVAGPGGFANQNGFVLRTDKSVDLRLQNGGALRISALQSSDNRPLGGAILNLTPENGAEATRALGSSADLNENVAFLAAGGDALSLLSRDGDGQTEINNVPPGRYVARLRLPGYAVPASQIVRIEAGQNADLAFSFAPAAIQTASLTLHLRHKNAAGVEIGAASAEWSLRVLPIDINGALAAEAREDSAFSPEGNIARRARSDQNGQITLFPLKVGRYRVFVAPRTTPRDEGEPQAPSVDVDVPIGGASASIVLPASP